jgi:hypothetical protein
MNEDGLRSERKKAELHFLKNALFFIFIRKKSETGEHFHQKIVLESELSFDES